MPTLVSEPPTPPPIPPSDMTPLTVADRLLPPTVSAFEPRKYLPAPSIEPLAMPTEDRPDMSKMPPAFMMKRALPPVAMETKFADPPLFAMMTASPAVLESLKNEALLLFVMVALPAVLPS